jgi:Arc/MetJ family transcription regulator
MTATTTARQGQCSGHEDRLPQRFLIQKRAIYLTELQMKNGKTEYWPQHSRVAVVDPDLIERALKVSGERTKKAAVTKALQEFIARREQKELAGLFGSLEWDGAFDHKTERSRD